MQSGNLFTFGVIHLVFLPSVVCCVHFRLHRIHNVAHCGRWSLSVVCLFIMWLRCAKTAEWIEVLFGVEALVDRRHIVLDGCPDPPTMSGIDNVAIPVFQSYLPHVLVLLYYIRMSFDIFSPMCNKPCSSTVCRFFVDTLCSSTCWVISTRYTSHVFVVLRWKLAFFWEK